MMVAMPGTVLKGGIDYEFRTERAQVRIFEARRGLDSFSSLNL